MKWSHPHTHQRLVDSNVDPVRHDLPSGEVRLDLALVEQPDVTPSTLAGELWSAHGWGGTGTSRLLQVRAPLVVAPTADDMLRVKAYLVVQRNQVRDYLDVVALADHLGPTRTHEALSVIDDYYDDRSGEHGSVLTSLVMHLADPSPRDDVVTRELHRYKRLDGRWHDWRAVVSACEALAMDLAEGRS